MKRLVLMLLVLGMLPVSGWVLPCTRRASVRLIWRNARVPLLLPGSRSGDASQQKALRKLESRYNARLV